jgi:hypothetical protein
MKFNLQHIEALGSVLTGAAMVIGAAKRLRDDSRPQADANDRSAGSADKQMRGGSPSSEGKKT